MEKKLPRRELFVNNAKPKALIHAFSTKIIKTGQSITWCFPRYNT